jgi:hypothetical protein
MFEIRTIQNRFKKKIRAFFGYWFSVGHSVIGSWTFLLLLPILAAVAFSGCAYQLGPTNNQTAGARSVQVTPFLNRTIEPRLSEYVTLEVRKQIQKDGTFRLNSSDDGDIIVSGFVTTFTRSGLSFQPTDVITPRDYWLSMVAHVTARERSTGKILLEQDVSGRTTMRVGNDLSSAERQATPLLAEDLARNITALLAEGKWWTK